MKKTSLLAAAALGLLALPLVANAQTTATWIGTSSNVWTNNANWSGGTFPNSSSSRAIFTGAAQAVWTNTNITVGSIAASNASGNVVIGDNTIQNETITLAGATKPTITVSNGSAALFMYANVLGTDGFIKDGGGRMTFRFNTNDHTYTGNIFINAGTLGIEKDRSLGDVNNDITFGGNSTLLSEPGANSGTVTLGSGRSITISNGVTAAINNGNAAVTTVVEGVIGGAGNLVFAGTGTLTLNGANNYTGTTLLSGGTLNLGASGKISTNALTVSNVVTMNLGGSSQTVASLTQTNNAANAARVTTMTNGSLTVGDGANLVVNGTNGTTLNLAGLTSFVANSPSRNLSVQPATSTVNGQTSIMLLATNSTGSNSLTYANITVGGATGASQGLLHSGELRLGKINEINATNFAIGAFNGTGVVAFNTGIGTGSVRLRSTDGSSRMGELVVGNTSSGTRSGGGILELGTADVTISNAYIGLFGANTASLDTTSRISMSSGTFDALNLTIGGLTNTTLTGVGVNLTATFQQDGGTATIQTLRMGDSQAPLNSLAPVFLSSYNLNSSSAVLKAQTITTGTSTNYAATSVRNINLTGGTIQNISGQNLSINGDANTSAGRINLVLGNGGGTLNADSGQTITVGANTLISNASGSGTPLVKAGGGTLVLAASNSYSGGTAVGNGTLVASNSNALGTGEVRVTNGATVLAGAATTVANNFTIGTPTAFVTNAYASTSVALWDFSTLSGGTGNYGPSPLAPTNTVAGLDAVGLTRGSGVGTSGSGAANAWGGVDFATASSAAAIAAGDFATFSVKVLDGYALNITNFGAYNVRRSGTGPTDGLWQWSTNGTTFTDIGSSITWGAVTTSSGNPQSAIALDGISALQSLSAGTTVTFRVANWNGAAAGTWYLNDPSDTTATDFSVGGQLATVTGSAYTGTGTLGIGEAGEATFSGNVLVGNTATLSAVASSKATFSGVISGPGTDITKSGAGTVTLSGTSANTFAGKTTLSEGTLELNKTAGVNAIAGNLEVGTGATLLISANNQVINSSAVTLSGGTISRASGVSETFGALNLTADSTLDYVGGTSGTLQFGDYEGDGAPAFKLTVNNFFGGNVLRFGSDLSSYISASYTGTAFTSTYFDINSISGGFTSSWDSGSGVFTITAIPEPSTVLAALGLTGLMLWPARRRLGALLARK